MKTRLRCILTGQDKNRAEDIFIMIEAIKLSSVKINESMEGLRQTAKALNRLCRYAGSSDPSYEIGLLVMQLISEGFDETRDLLLLYKLLENV